MPTLAPSLRALFNELDATWPNRDRRTDGWSRGAPGCPGTSDHCVDSQGRVHAVDIDKDGINAGFVVTRLTKYRGVVRYINYMRYHYHVRNDYEPTRITQGHLHEDHIHVSIERTATARGYVGGYGIASGTASKPIVIPDLQIVAQSSFDHAPLVTEVGGYFGHAGDSMKDFATAIGALRL